jgi:hypothetical protein
MEQDKLEMELAQIRELQAQEAVLSEHLELSDDYSIVRIVEGIEDRIDNTYEVLEYSL